MDFLSTILVGVIGGMVISILLQSQAGKSGSIHNHGAVATKDDVVKLREGIEEIKNLQKNTPTIAEAEQEFYDELRGSGS